MRKRAKRRSFTPRLAVLEQRRLLSFAAEWLGQDGHDFIGTASLATPKPNDYQDIHIRLTGLTHDANTATSILVKKQNKGGWTWVASGTKNAVFVPDPSDSTAGDLYMEPQEVEGPGRHYETIRVDYVNGSFDQTNLTLQQGDTVDPNLRMPGTELGATFLGQVNDDWTGPYISVGPDGIKDVRINLSNLSEGAAVEKVKLTATSTAGPTLIWEAGLNNEGNLNAEFLYVKDASVPEPIPSLYFSPDVDLAGYSLTIVATYGENTNRDHRTHTAIISAEATNPNLLFMPDAAEANLPQARAASLPQATASPGYSRVALDSTSLPNSQTLATVRSAVLSNLHGSSWSYTKPGAPAPYTGGSSPQPMTYDSATGVFGFPPVRDETGSILTLLLTFDDGKQAVARFAAAPSDINLRDADTRIGAVEYVAIPQVLLAKLQNKVPNIHLAAGTYVLDKPLILDYPVRITADPGAILTFNLTNTVGEPWKTSSGAIRITSSHVALDGFAIRFAGNSGMWKASEPFVIQANGGTKVDLSFTHLDIQAPAAEKAEYEVAIGLMNFEGENSGLIADNTFKGGPIQLGVGPWAVLDNDYQGAVAYTIAPTFLNVLRSHDLTIRGNHLHAVAPAGITRRFLNFGRSDLGQGIGNLIENNIVDGGIGSPVGGPEEPVRNSPEIILMESYQPRFEGKPAAISPDGFIIQVPYLRGPLARTGDVVSIVSGPHAGEWRMIALALGQTQYLLNEPLPQGDYIVTIGRGYVHQTFRGNTIDIRNMSPGNVAMVLPGNQWGTRILDNTFLGGNGISIHAGSSQEGFETQGVQQQLAPWGWSRLPIFDVTIDGNTFEDAQVKLAVAHGQRNKANSGRTYFTGVFSNNYVEWSDPDLTKSAVVIGVGAKLVDNSNERIPLDYTRANYSWVTPGEIQLTVKNNWGYDSTTSLGPKMQVYAAKINGAETDNQAMGFSLAPTMTAVSRGQDGSDYFGSATGPDGFQDVHIVLANLPAGTTISQIIITGYGGGEWRLIGSPGAYSVGLVRNGTTADLYIQPYQNETGRYLTVRVEYADHIPTQAIVEPIYAMARLPVPPNPSVPGFAGSRVIAINSGGSSTTGAFQPDAYVTGGNYFATTHAIDTSGVANPAPEAVYKTELYGQFTYTIPGLTPGGSYTVRLHFSENYHTGAGQRLFNVAINGATALSQFDIFAAAGGMYKAVVREITATADANGQIVIDFNGSDPKSNGIEIVVPAADLARGRVATSSTDESATYSPGKAVDGDASTRWSSGQWMQNNDIGWIQVDLGSIFDIDRVRLNWEAAFGVDYLIQVSDDANDWTTVESVVGNSSAGAVEHANLSARGRYVRIYCTRVNATKNYSLYDFQVFGA